MGWQGHLVDPFSWPDLGWQEILSVPGLAGRCLKHIHANVLSWIVWFEVERGQVPGLAGPA